MGRYNEDDKVPGNLVGLDCPFEDSPVFKSLTKNDLIDKVMRIYEGVSDINLNMGISEFDFYGTWPDVICDDEGNLLLDVYKMLKITSDLNLKNYSWGKENLNSLWKREKWRFGFNND